MARILASSVYSFHQLLPSWLWSPVGCILESVLGPWGSFFLVVFVFLPFLVSLVLLLFLLHIFLFLLLLFFLLSPPFLLSLLHFLLLSSPSLLLPAFLLLLFLSWLLLSPSVLQSSACSFCHSFVSFCYFFAVFCRFLFPCLLSPPVSVLLLPPVCGLPSLPALFSCRLFLLFLSDHRLLGDANCPHLCFPFCRLLHYSCPILGASPHPPSLFFSSASSLVPPVSYLSSMTSFSRTSLAPFFPKDLCSSPFISTGAGPSSASDFFVSAGSTTFSFGPCLVTFFTSCSLYDDPLL